METTNQINTDFIENLLDCFEDRINKIEAVFNTSEAVNESSNTLVNDFRQSLQELRKEMLLLNSLLRDNLAKNGSLRKNDYDFQMDEVFQALNEMENEAECEFSGYIEEQKAMTHYLRQGILDIKYTGINSNANKIEAYRAGLEPILKMLQLRKECAISKFIVFQEFHKKVASNFHQLLDPDMQAFCKDIKNLKKQLLN